MEVAFIMCNVLTTKPHLLQQIGMCFVQLCPGTIESLNFALEDHNSFNWKIYLKAECFSKKLKTTQELKCSMKNNLFSQFCFLYEMF